MKQNIIAGAKIGGVVAGSMLLLGMSSRLVPVLEGSAFSRTVKRAGLATGLAYAATKTKYPMLAQGFIVAFTIQTLFDLAVSSIPRTNQLNPPADQNPNPANGIVSLGSSWAPRSV